MPESISLPEPGKLPELLFVSRPEGAQAAVVFIHGLGGHHYDTWGPKGEPATFVRRLASDLPEAAVATYGYSSGRRRAFNPSRLSVEELAKVWKGKIRESLLRPYRSVAILCHSLGGVVTLTALRHLLTKEPDWAGRLQERETRLALFLMGVPQEGTDTKRTGWLSDELRVLTYNGELVRNNTEFWQSRVQQPERAIEADLPIATFAVVSEADEWVPQLSAGANLPESHILRVALSHTDMVKPPPVGDFDSYGFVLARMKEWLREPSRPLQAPSPGAAPEDRAALAEEDRPEGVLPPVWNVPFLRNPNFSGRQRELERLEAARESGERQAIAGLGGVGKSQLAAEYAYRHRGDCEPVWWLRCEEPATLKSDYAALGEKLHLDPQRDIEVAVAQVKEWLERHSGWLLIFDYAQRLDDLRHYLPQAEGGQVLITSRNRAWGAVAKRFDVDPWSPEESVEFLEKRTGRREPEAAAELAGALGWLPLALEQAAAYVVEKERGLAGYLELYSKHRLVVLEKGEPADSYEGTVATTWNLSLAQVEQASRAASQLMALCAYLAPEEIPLDVIREGRGYLPEPLQGTLSDELALDEALGALLRYSLIERSGRQLSVHRLVQEVVRPRNADGPDLLLGAVEILAAAWPRGAYWDTRVWPDCDRLQPHALAVLERAGAASAPTAGSLWNALGGYAHGRASLSEARARFERALGIYEEASGPDHPAVAACVNNLGLVFRDLRDAERATALFKRALAIGEAAYRPDHPQVAIYVNNFGLALKDLGKPERAKVAFEQALAIGEAAYGPDHPQVAIYVNNLGEVFEDLEEPETAKVLFQRALAIEEAAHGPDHPTVAVRVNNLGKVFKDLGDLEAAKAHFERALAISEAAYGSDHPGVAIPANNLGDVLRDLGNLEGAKEHYERALAIDETAFGPDHPSVARDFNNLGMVLQALGDLEEAKALCERALAIATRSLGSDHVTTQRYLQNLESLSRGAS